jgi:diguanylate cyclase (GGDEF)-like protein
MLDYKEFNSVKTIVNNTGAFIYVIDLQSHEILYANERCIKEFGNIIGKTCFKTLQKNENSPCHFCPLEKIEEPTSLALGTTFEWENKNSINGRYYLFNDCIVEWKENKRAKIQVGIDITKQKKLEEEVLRLVNYDSLTKLANRTLLKKIISDVIAKNHKTAFYNALLFINIDDFKKVNDKYGHYIGDKLLIEISNRIKKSLRTQNIISRIGGDEFIVLIETNKKDETQAIEIFETISQKILESLKDTYCLDDYEFKVSASIGIKLFNDKSASVDKLITHADNAMYNAKGNGKNTFCFFDPKLQKIMEDKIILTDALKEAIEQNEMSLYYQTQILSNKREEIVGVEALIRWNHIQRGMISPTEFIPLAEESGLIIPLGEWIIHEACKQLNQWKNDKNKKNWRVSINVSSKQFEMDGFVKIIKSIVDKYDINPNMLRLELTESLLIKNIDKVLDRLHELKDIGFSLSIDDFGTGYSSLSYLKKLPIDELKIDQSFISELTTDVNDEVITQTIISIGEKFGLDVIAEGVETKEQYEKLIEMGCKHFQGYFFSKPLSKEEL